jgi:crotonobetainyl-CoA:carnitine CoA-transferase CaiB-like acyl-CoA transferase
MDTNRTLPLHGVRVLDLSRVLAGPLATMMLGDLGADVIKVERAGTGDDTRGWGPPFHKNGQSAYFLSANRNKLSLAADFKSPEDLRLLRELMAEADVVIENFLPGALARSGLDRKELLEQHPNLIWCTISGFGPESMRPGYDFVVQAESGWMAITGPEQGAPHKIGVALVDVITGKDAAIAILAALAGRHRPRSIDERTLHISLQQSAAAALVNVAQNALVSGNEAKRWGNAHPNLVPYQLFDAADGPFVIAVGSDSQWQSAVHALELTSLLGNRELDTNAGRLAHRDLVVGTIAQRVKSGTSQEWVSKLEAAGVPCGVVKGVLDAINEIVASPETGVGPSAGGQVRLAPPRLDEHGTQIRNLHWSAFKVVPILD